LCGDEGLRKSKPRRSRNVVLYHRKLYAEGAGSHGQNPKTNRREAVEKLVTAGGGKLVAMYGTIAEGPGAMVIFEADPAVAPAIAGVAASSDGVTNVKYQRLFSGDEVRAIRQKRVELQKSYRPPGK
jgi:uncharacterized protein with GYD domain